MSDYLPNQSHTLFAGRAHEVLSDLFLGPMPHADWDLAAAGISLVISLSENLPPQAGEKQGLTDAQGHGRVCYVHWPFTDGDIPEIALLNLLVSLVNTALDQGRRVLVHCSAGVNRSALLAALVARERLGITGAEAVRLVQAARPGTLRNSDFRDYLDSLPTPTPA